MEEFTTCICKATIPVTHPYCLENKNCLEYIIEKVSYLFDDSVPKAQIESFVKSLPITINKQLIKKEPLDLTKVDEFTREKILESEITPIDFLLPLIVQNYPENLLELQKNSKMIEFGKEIRKRNFSKAKIEKLARLSDYFALFFYESRNHPIWKVVLDSLIKAPFTPETLLRHLDGLFRRDAVEYLRFFAVLSQNSSLTRIIYLIESMKSSNINSANQEENKPEKQKETEEIMPISKLNNYAHHWFPGIVLASLKHPDIYKTTLDKSYDELYNWKNLFLPLDILIQIPLYNNELETPQTINPLINEILIAILSHLKVSSKLLAKETNNQEPTIRKRIVLSSNSTIPILEKLQEDTDDYIRKIAKFRLTILKKEREIAKNITENNETELSSIKVVLAPNYINDIFKDFHDSQYY